MGDLSLISESDSLASLGAFMIDSSVKMKFVRIWTKKEVAVAIKATYKNPFTNPVIVSLTTPKYNPAQMRKNLGSICAS